MRHKDTHIPWEGRGNPLEGPTVTILIAYFMTKAVAKSQFSRWINVYLIDIRFIYLFEETAALLKPSHFLRKLYETKLFKDYKNASIGCIT